MKAKLLTYILFLLSGFCFNAAAQNPTGKEANIWYFGYKAGLDFNYSPPRALTNGKADGFGGFSSICDGNGNLLFYTTPDSILDRNHQKMPNSPIAFNGSSLNTSVVVPWPSNPGKYFCFSTVTVVGFSYSVIDMSLRNGLGDVVPNQKNIVIQTYFYSKIAAVQHQNRRDIWVIAHRALTNSYDAFLVTPSGVNATPVSSQIGMISDTGTGAFKVSPDGSMLASVVFPNAIFDYTPILLLDFDNVNGSINGIGIIPDSAAAGVEFSPDGSFLYCTHHQTSPVNPVFPDKLVQYDLRHPTVAAMFANRKLVASRPGVPGNVPHFGFMQIGPDGKIYMSIISNSFSFVSVLEKPNELWPIPKFTFQGININPDNLGPRPRISRWALPTFVQSYFFKPSIYLHQSCLGDTAYHFSINNSGPIDSVRWNFGDPASGKHNTSTLFSPWHSYATGGTYNVQVIAYFQFGSDTLQQSITIPGPPLRNVLGKDTTLCAGSTYTFSPNVPQALSYLWPDNSTDSVFQVSQPGTYWVEIITECGPYRDYVNVDFLTPPSFSLGNDLFLCSGQTYTLKPNLQDVTYLWQDGSTADSMVVTKPGLYEVQVTNRCGSSKDKIWANYRQAIPADLLGPDTVLCEGVNYELKANGNYTFRWQDGSRNSSFTVSKAGTYFADITNAENCIVRDSVTVSYKNCFGEEYLIPNIITPNSDGKNDSFVIWGAKEGTLELSIYNRWGTQVYQTNNYQNNWNAENASAGIYYYLLRNKQTGKNNKGWIEVVK